MERRARRASKRCRQVAGGLPRSRGGSGGDAFPGGSSAAHPSRRVVGRLPLLALPTTTACGSLPLLQRLKKLKEYLKQHCEEAARPHLDCIVGEPPAVHACAASAQHVCRACRSIPCAPRLASTARCTPALRPRRSEPSPPCRSLLPQLPHWPSIVHPSIRFSALQTLCGRCFSTKPRTASQRQRRCSTPSSRCSCEQPPGPLAQLAGAPAWQHYAGAPPAAGCAPAPLAAARGRC